MARRPPTSAARPDAPSASGGKARAAVVPVIEIRGARQNNLKGIDLDLPLGELIVVTGPSGSGKSSLAFDTIYAEGQRRYIETFSPYTRQFFERMDKPRVDDIRGIPPAIAIEQSNSVRNTRSTVGTMTEINDYLKLLFPRIAMAVCPGCGRDVRPETPQHVALVAMKRFAGREVLVTFPVPVPTGAVPADFFAFLQTQGFMRVRVFGEVHRTDEPAVYRRKTLPGVVDVIQDRVRIIGEPDSKREDSGTGAADGIGGALRVEESGPARRTNNHATAAIDTRLLEGLEQAFHFGKGRVCLVDAANGTTEAFSRGWHCAHCDLTIREPTPALFSFNNPVGACPQCRGFGRTIGIDIERALPDPSLSIRGGVVKAFQGQVHAECQRDLMRAARARGVDVDCPFEDLPESERRWVIEGDSSDPEEAWRDGLWYGVRGFFKWLEGRSYKMHVRIFLSRYRAYTTCAACAGGRLQPEALNFRVDGRTLPDWWRLPVRDLARLVRDVHPPDPTSAMLLGEISSRLGYLERVGLGYLTLDRAARTLSGGEIERVNLTSCLGASLVNTLFVMDEPSVGLHPRDVTRMIDVMHDLRDKGNTLLVVEHEEAVIRAADRLVDIGPGRGRGGGELVCVVEMNRDAGYRKKLISSRALARSLTLQYLDGEKVIPVPETRRPRQRARLRIIGAAQHNLKRIDVEIPLGNLVCLTGVSGSGKSTLVHDVLFENLLRLKGQTSENEPGRCRGIEGAQLIDRVIMVDQSPLSRTPRSTPAVYVGAFDGIRALFASTADARAQGLTPSFFSFNSGSGRCQRCGGAGAEKVEMQFLSDLFVTCPACQGTRYTAAALEINLDGRTIADVLDMTVSDAIEFFGAADARIGARLQLLADVGLDYLKLGQPLNTLSGGECQRLKLVGHLTDDTRGSVDSVRVSRSLARPGAGSKDSRREIPSGKRASEGKHTIATAETRAPQRPTNLLIFDEPTTGLHFDDVRLLLEVFHRLVDEGNSILVIEHNVDVIKNADWVIDLGPEAGADGGMIVAAGTPESVAQVDSSHTGRFLRRALGLERQGNAVASVREEPPLRRRTVLSHANGREIAVLGAREHNLKNLSLHIPRDQFVVITGLSGSGKSTLAFDILFAEGQRRFLDSMSPYARQFVEQLERPDVDHIEGLPPTVAIEQRLTRGGGKSTVATVTEVYHFLRLLFSKVGTQHCPRCDVPVTSRTAAEIAAAARTLARAGSIKVLATVIKARKGFHDEVARWAAKQGFDEMLVDGRFVLTAGFKRLERFKEHTIDVVVAEFGGGRVSAGELQQAVERALEIGKGSLKVWDRRSPKSPHVFSAEMTCPECGWSFEPLDPRLFSFNSPHGWCPECRGFGTVPDRSHVVPDRPDQSQLEAELRDELRHEGDEESAATCAACGGTRINEVARAVRVMNANLPEAVWRTVSDAQEWLGTLRFTGRDEVIARDILVEIRQRLHFMERVGLGYLALDRAARTLSGGESQRIRLAAQLGSNLRGVLYILDEPTIGLHPRDNERLLDTLDALRDKGNSLIVVEHDEGTMKRADRLIDLGPGAGNHGGELVAEGSWDFVKAQPHSPTGQALSEPMTHPLRGARRPVAPASSLGVREEGRLDVVQASSLQRTEASKLEACPSELHWLTVTGARANNLKNVTARIPVGRLTVITGVSGSGKSSLLRGVIEPAVKSALDKRSRRRADTWTAATGADRFDAVYEVDQSPIGKTSRSCPATYIGIFDDIRKLFAGLPASRLRGYTASRFSFNTEGGRCEACKGNGRVKLEMAFLPTSRVACEECGGLRYNAATLEVEYNGKSIGDVMRLTIDEAAQLFSAVPNVARTLRLLVDTGLGYLQLGQPSPTLSGGEAQRIKLVTELTRGAGRSETARLRKNIRPKGSLYLIEEPTIGLHITDVRRLIDVLHHLVDDGHTVVVIEHNLDVIAEADYIIDIGPEPGSDGGEIVTSGTPEHVAASKRSLTARFLKPILARSAR